MVWSRKLQLKDVQLLPIEPQTPNRSIFSAPKWKR